MGALERRQEFLKQQEDLHMKITSSQFNVGNAKTRQQLEEEREAFIKNAVFRVQEEALMLSNRAKEEEMKRLEYIRLEQKAERERMRLLKRQQEEEERQRLEKLRLAEERKVQVVEKSEQSKRMEESNRMAELKRQEELRQMEKQRLEQMIYQESKVVKGQVSKRSDDVHGLGWGNVTTGFVSKTKLGFLQREMSMERDSNEGSPAPGGFGSRTRGLRVTFADSPGGSRPGSSAGWAERVTEMDSQSLRAQTPPPAGEWAVSKGSKSESIINGSSSLVQSQGINTIQSSSFHSSGSSNLQSSHMSSSMSSSKQSSSQTSSFSSTFSSTQKSSFSSSSIQASKAFEAFPGMGGIENLKLEEGDH